MIKFPWPPRTLSPNSRKDRRYTGKDRKAYKEAWWALTKARESRPFSQHLIIRFCPPDGRKRDLDNMLGSIKYGIDGLALALGIDDYHFSFEIYRDKPEKPDGAVYVQFGNVEEKDND